MKRLILIFIILSTFLFSFERGHDFESNYYIEGLSNAVIVSVFDQYFVLTSCGRTYTAVDTVIENTYTIHVGNMVHHIHESNLIVMNETESVVVDIFNRHFVLKRCGRTLIVLERS